jgi:hypothetical protein
VLIYSYDLFQDEAHVLKQFYNRFYYTSRLYHVWPQTIFCWKTLTGWSKYTWPQITLWLRLYTASEKQYKASVKRITWKNGSEWSIILWEKQKKPIIIIIIIIIVKVSLCSGSPLILHYIFFNPLCFYRCIVFISKRNMLPQKPYTKNHNFICSLEASLNTLPNTNL